MRLVRRSDAIAAGECRVRRRRGRVEPENAGQPELRQHVLHRRAACLGLRQEHIRSGEIDPHLPAPRSFGDQ